jgi:hypothetical protein
MTMEDLRDCPACGPMHQIGPDAEWCDDCGEYHTPPVTTYDFPIGDDW